MNIPVGKVFTTVKTVIRNLPTIRKEIVSAVTAVITLIGVFEVTFPAISVAHLAFFSAVMAALTGVASFLSNNKVVADIDDFANQPVWKAVPLRAHARLKCLAGKT